MEQHPVPQNVTTFQFRLIGDMTIKQFGYLAGGAILAYISYKLPLPFFFTWPLTIVSAVGGFGLAFVPIEERPMDVWVLSFLKSVYSPTQFVWRKDISPSQPPTTSTTVSTLAGPAPLPQAQTAPIDKHPFSQKLQQLFTPSSRSAKPVVPTAPMVPGPAIKTPTPYLMPTKPLTPATLPRSPFAWFRDWFKPQPPKTPRVTVKPTVTTSYPDIFANAPLPPVTGKRFDFSPPPRVIPKTVPTPAVEEALAKATNLEKKLAEVQEELASKTATDARILELQQQLRDLMTDRNKMEHEILTLRQKLTRPAGDVVRLAAAAVPMPKTTTPTVKVLGPDVAVKAGLPKLTTFPNVVTGIIKDHEGNLLPGVLITVRDKDDVPLRALKTNKLGQFAASTPLPSGTYLVEVEDPRDRFSFDRAQITLSGWVLPPLEIIAKSQKEISRDKLAREIFGEPKL